MRSSRRGGIRLGGAARGARIEPCGVGSHRHRTTSRPHDVVDADPRPRNRCCARPGPGRSVPITWLPGRPSRGRLAAPLLDGNQRKWHMHPRLHVAGIPPLTIVLAAILVGPLALASPPPSASPFAPRDAHVTRTLAGSPFARTAAPYATADAADGTWQEIDLLQVRAPQTLHDQASDALLSIVGSRFESWALPLGGAATWQPLPPPQSTAFINFVNSAQDPTTGLVYFPEYVGQFFEFRTLDPLAGTVATVPGTPQQADPLMGTVAFDGETHRLFSLVVDSPAPVPLQKVWVLDLQPTPVWSQWTPTGTPPPSRPFLLAVADPVRRRLVLPNIYGGIPPETIWALTLDGAPQWLSFTTNGLPGGANPNPMVYDPVGDRVWTVDRQCEVYNLSLDTYQWSHVTTTGPGPSPRRYAGITIDSIRRRLLVTGGESPSGEDMHSDTWALPLDAPPAWTQPVPDPARPRIRWGAGDAYDAARNRMLLFAGIGSYSGFYGETWELDLASAPHWAPVATQGSPPSARYFPATAWDDARDQFLIFGGNQGGSAGLADLWALSFASTPPAWSQVIAPGPNPPGRLKSNFVYDPPRDRFLLLLGEHDNNQLLNDVWELRLTPAPAWRLLTPSGSPPAARADAMVARDPGHDRLLVFGGMTSSTMNDLWALDLAGGDGAWQQLPVAPGPSPRISGLLRLDTVRNRLLLFGGYGQAQVGNAIYTQTLNDSWALVLASTPIWQPLSPEGRLPQGRYAANGAFEPVHSRLMLTCGNAANGEINDLWSLTFDDPTATLLALATREVNPDRVRLVWSGAEPGSRATAYRRNPGVEWQSIASLLADGEGFVTLEDRDVMPGATLEYRLGIAGLQGEEFFGATAVQIPLRSLSLAAKAVNGGASFAIELPNAEPATLSLFDVSGRLAWSASVAQLGAGSHVVSLDGVALPAALYFVRLMQGPESRVARAVVFR